MLFQAQLNELEAVYNSINPAQLTRQILTYQDRLMALAKDKTLAMAATIEDEQQARAARQETGIKITAG